MDKKQYLEMRNKLITEAEDLVKSGDVEASAEKREEITNLDVDFDKASKEMANLQALRGEGEPMNLDGSNNELKNGWVAVDNVVTPQNAVNYEDVFAKVALKRDLTPEEVNVFNGMNPSNVYTHSTTNTEIVIPETVVSGIINTMAEMHPILADVRSTRIKGTVKYIKHTDVVAGDADYYDEATPTVDEENAFGELTLNGKELSKAVTVTWKLQAMATADFIPFLQRELGERMGYAKANAFIRGSGDAKYPQGIITALNEQADTPQITEYTEATGITYADITGLMAKLKSKYTSGAKIYANNQTIWNQLANIVDGNGRPIFVADATVGGAGRIFGIPVVEEDGMQAGELLLGNVNAGYVENIQESMTLTTEQHAKGRKTDFVGYEVHDGGVMDENAFAVIRKSDVPAG